jgi:hypothetical protein
MLNERTISPLARSFHRSQSPGEGGQRAVNHPDVKHHANSSSSAFASFRSGVSKPSVNQP